MYNMYKCTYVDMRKYGKKRKLHVNTFYKP